MFINNNFPSQIVWLHWKYLPLPTPHPPPSTNRRVNIDHMYICVIYYNTYT